MTDVTRVVLGIALVLCTFIICVTWYSVHEGTQKTQRETACVSSGQSWVAHHSFGDQVYECKPHR